MTGQEHYGIIATMANENRIATRYDDMGRVTCNELCAVNGTLINISKTGCKVSFPVNVVVDLSNEYELTILLAKKSLETPLNLICKPQWVQETGGSTEIGFQTLYCPDLARQSKYIDFLEEQDSDDLPEIV